MTTAADPNPTVARRRLAVYFKKLREQHEYGLDTLSEVLGVDPSQASRLDTGARGFKVADVGRLCALYAIDAAERDRLTAIAEESRKRAWWQQLALPNSVRTLIGMEQAAVAINEFAPTLLPGLLQTREYAEAAAAATNEIDVPQRLLDAAIKARMRRQTVLKRANPPDLWFVIDEATLARVAGGRTVMRGQLQRLLDIGSLRHVTIQVVGFEYGIYAPGGSQHFQILVMEDLPDIVYVEDMLRHFDTADEDVLRSRRKVWDTLRSLALSPRDSLARIDGYRQQLTD